MGKSNSLHHKRGVGKTAGLLASPRAKTKKGTAAPAAQGSLEEHRPPAKPPGLSPLPSVPRPPRGPTPASLHARSLDGPEERGLLPRRRSGARRTPRAPVRGLMSPLTHRRGKQGGTHPSLARGCAPRPIGRVPTSAGGALLNISLLYLHNFYKNEVYLNTCTPKKGI